MDGLADAAIAARIRGVRPERAPGVRWDEQAAPDLGADLLGDGADPPGRGGPLRPPLGSSRRRRDRAIVVLFTAPRFLPGVPRREGHGGAQTAGRADRVERCCETAPSEKLPASGLDAGAGASSKQARSSPRTCGSSRCAGLRRLASRRSPASPRRSRSGSRPWPGRRHRSATAATWLLWARNRDLRPRRRRRGDHRDAHRARPHRHTAAGSERVTPLQARLDRLGKELAVVGVAGGALLALTSCSAARPGRSGAHRRSAWRSRWCPRVCRP